MGDLPVSPWTVLLRLERALPSAVRGPLDFFELSRFAFVLGSVDMSSSDSTVRGGRTREGRVIWCKVLEGKGKISWHYVRLARRGGAAVSFRRVSGGIEGGLANLRGGVPAVRQFPGNVWPRTILELARDCGYTSGISSGNSWPLRSALWRSGY